MTVPSAARIWIISADGSTHSVHTTDPSDYLERLKLRYPETQWDLDDFIEGELPGHAKLAWGGRGVWNWETKKVEGFGQIWVWESESEWKPITPPCLMPRLSVIYMGVASEASFAAKVSRMYGKLNRNPQTGVVQ